MPRETVDLAAFKALEKHAKTQEASIKNLKADIADRQVTADTVTALAQDQDTKLKELAAVCDAQAERLIRQTELLAERSSDKLELVKELGQAQRAEASYQAAISRSWGETAFWRGAAYALDAVKARAMERVAPPEPHTQVGP